MTTITRRENRRVPPSAWAILLVIGVVLSVTFAITFGPASITAGDVWSSVLSHLGLGASPLTPLRDGIVWQLRLPRVLTAAAVGAGLAIAGAVMQALTRNSLADPYLLGLSSGASLGAVSVLLLGVSILLPVAAFAGALLALLLTLLIASSGGGMTPSRTVLAGVAVSSLGAALTSFIIFWTAKGDSYREILNWLLGSLAGADWSAVAIGAVALVIVGVPIIMAGRSLDAFSFGDTAAAALGVSVGRTRWLLLVSTALLTGAMVSVSGSIGFVGLVLPHAVRLVVGSRHRVLLPLSALVGAIFLIWCDTIARTMFDPRELPVGIITAVIGAPLFVMLLVRRPAGSGRP
ncbi:putative F420-0 ABC transporter permease subunit [Glaciihabitans sp. dw_435]|uniref:putative F420-0 ABC transporter permease subunit n=1 Tax=Glaciihabitans sp. dw_435 TaxID=2720081 RepID=UPI001BD5FA0D|nr:putative F420-0 ABC transporter permease subunit [Glaciihabitans sp. dw_435]